MIKKTVTIRGIGHLEIRSEIDDKAGARITGDFMHKLVTGIAKWCGQNIEAELPAAFSYKELQLNSIIVPAIAQFAEAFLMEYPLYKEDKLKKTIPVDSFRRIDYWVYYRKTDIYMEIKHSRISFNSKTIRKDIMPLWQEVCKQSKQAYKRAASEATGGARGTVTIALQVFTIYQTTKKMVTKGSEIYDEGKLSNIWKEYYDILAPEPNWSGLLRFNKQFIKKSCSTLENSKEYYPGILFIARASELVNFENQK
jgi:hypothetical protein